MNYTVDYFIRKFNRIPNRLWTTGRFKSSNGKKCVLGHCGMYSTLRRTEIAMNLNSLFYKKGFVTDINDGAHPFFRQKRPKARILAALRWIKAQSKSKLGK